jgi:DNA modification methylase
LSKDKNNYNFYDETKSLSNVIEGINQDIPIYNGDKAGGIDEHPTQKPVELMKRLIKIHSKSNDLILDPFLGGGTTAVACKQLGRRFIGIEIREKYCEIARKKLEYTEKPLF